MAQCSTTPTATQYTTVTLESLATTFLPVTTTLPGSSVTQEFVTCSTVDGTEGCSTFGSVTTFPGSTTTTSTPAQYTSLFTTTSPTATLYSTTCSGEISSSSENGGSSQTSSQPPTSSTPTSSTPLPQSTSFSVTASASTLPGGAVVTISKTATIIVTPSGSTDSNHSNTPVGPIVGGVLGGVGFIAVVLLAAWFIMRRRREQRDDDFDQADAPITPFVVRQGRRPPRGEGIDETSAVEMGQTNTSTVSGAGRSNSISAGLASSVHRRNATTTPGGSGSSSEHSPEENTGLQASSASLGISHSSAGQGIDSGGSATHRSTLRTMNVDPTEGPTSSSTAPLVHQDGGVAGPLPRKGALDDHPSPQHEEPPPAYEE